MTQWISVAERLPKNDRRVLVVLRMEHGARVDITWFQGGCWAGPNSFDDWTDYVTHWMPAPALPEAT